VLGASDRDALEKAKALFFDLTKLVDSRVSLSIDNSDGSGPTSHLRVGHLQPEDTPNERGACSRDQYMSVQATSHTVLR
jgi:hypothetical protein